ncbi:MAG: ParB/RepB/Spo0J family partition protein [Myxococcota bacterium]
METETKKTRRMLILDDPSPTHAAITAALSSDDAVPAAPEPELKLVCTVCDEEGHTEAQCGLRPRDTHEPRPEPQLFVDGKCSKCGRDFEEHDDNGGEGREMAWGCPKPPVPAEEAPVAPDDAVIELHVTPPQTADDVLAILSQSGTLGEAVEKIAEARATAEEHLERQVPGPGFRTLPLEQLRESPTNPRKAFNGMEELTASVRKLGVMQPLMARPVEGGFEIVFGHRRFRAAQAAGLESVPVDVRELTDVQVLEAQLVENVQRADIHPLEEAEAYQRLIDTAGYTAEQLAAKVGRSRGWIYQRLKLLALGPEARKAFEEGRIALSVAIPLARVPTHKLQAKAVERILGGAEEWSARNAIEWLQNEFCVSLTKAPFDRKDDMLVEGAPACTACPKRSGCGTPGLFDDLKGQDICTDTTCYQAKTRATWEARAERYARQGAEVLTPSEAKKLFRDGALQHGTAYVAADQPINEDKQRRTWSDILEKAKQPPKLVVAPDADMKPRRLYRADEALAAAAELGHSWAKTKATRVAAQREDTPEAIGEKKLREVRARVAREVLVAGAMQIRSGAEIPRMAYALLARAVDATRTGEAATEYLQKLKVEDVAKWAQRAEPKALVGFLFAALLEEWCGGTWNGFDEGLEEAAKAFGFDLKKLVAGATAAEAGASSAPAPKEDAKAKAEALFKPKDEKKLTPKKK